MERMRQLRFFSTLYNNYMDYAVLETLRMTLLFMGKQNKNMMKIWTKCLQRLYDRGLRLNQSKCKFDSNTLEFFGQIFSEAGTQPDPKRVKECTSPTKRT